MTPHLVARLTVTTAALLLAAACGGPSGGGRTAGVRIKGFTYTPTPTTIPAGTTVIWTNRDDILHTVTSGTPDAPDREPLDGVLDGPGTSYEATFTEPGTFEYFCARHNGMRGTVTVA